MDEVNVTIIVAVIGAVASVLTVVCAKIHEQMVELRKIKEKQYIDFLTFLTKAKLHNENNRQEIEAELSVRIQTIYLVGNKNVQKALTNFLDLFFKKIKNHKKNYMETLYLK